jgi:hypothetical protein
MKWDLLQKIAAVVVTSKKSLPVFMSHVALA